VDLTSVDIAGADLSGPPPDLSIPREICNNGIDDDKDGLIDCADPDCFGSLVCQKSDLGTEICDNGIDDNGDNLVDCADPQCVNFPACLAINCSFDVDFGTINPKDSSVTRVMNTVGAAQTFHSCAVPGGTARVGKVTLSGKADVKLDFMQAQGGAHVISLFQAGVDQKCDQNLVRCVNAGELPSTSTTFAGLDAGNYWIIVQSFPGTQGSTVVTLSTSSSSTPEICNNGIDDDKNGLIDCADSACLNDPNCTASQCNPDINLGALVVDGPSKAAVVNTTTSTNRYHPTCAGTSTGDDIVVEFTLFETAGILVQWTQTGDHVFGLFGAPAQGNPCDTNQLSCYYPGGISGGSVAWSARPPGTYLFIFKPIMAGKEGTININVSAFKNRMVEICNNGIDDDGNGLVDCNDPACFGVGNCSAPLCMPDVDLGDFSVGTSQSTTLNTATGQDIWKTTCGKGNGKERVVRVNLLEPMALGFNCTETGSHVLELSQQVDPLDGCDAHNFNCADPQVLPFGCNFAMPNLQAGKYNVIVEAFQAGSEGTVNLTLFGIGETVLEICDNGIDDDMDGFTDCMDKKCVTSPLCAKFQCRADQNLGIVPLGVGVPGVNGIVQTSNAGDDQTMTPCVSGAGGQDQVVDFELPGKADITIQWAQVGNHAFALYQNTTSLLACEDNPLINCTASMGSQVGSIPLTGVPKGKYHLVVDAAQAGTEGGVVLQISGVPSP
jgi:hypothetical protein